MLVFSARGEPPFTIAYGNARGAACQGRVENILAGLSDRGNEPVSMMASFGPQVTLSGEMALRPVTKQFNWKILILWAVLVGGVVLMGWMALGLYREMNQKGGGQPSS